MLFELHLVVAPREVAAVRVLDELDLLKSKDVLETQQSSVGFGYHLLGGELGVLQGPECGNETEPATFLII